MAWQQNLKYLSKSCKREKISVLRKKLWRVFSEYIRRRDLKDGCISCGKRFASLCRDWHAGHYYSKGASWATLYYDEKNVNGQCSKCNSFQEGNKQGYMRGLMKRYGDGILDKLEYMKQFRNVWTAFEYQVLIDSYKQKVKDLGGGR